ncbi:hypothetical protein CF328_g4795 [Tilletia controversa]|nr:hypothetical protein CF328_g4795 [Tilletia controversa]
MEAFHDLSEDERPSDDSVKDQETEKRGIATESLLPGPPEDKLHRGLNGLHMQMIAFGGSIGTGLFVGSGHALATGGPLFLVLNFALVGIMLFTVVMALGELATALPVSGSLASYSTRMIHPAWGFAMGWNYWMQWVVALPFELTVSTIVIRYWDVDGKITSGVWITIFLVLITIINFFGVKGYGNVEVAGSMFKIVAVLAFFIIAIVIDAGGAPSGQYFGAKTWSDPGPTNNGFKGFCSVFVTAAFGYAGTELVGLAARESANPRKEIPKASKQVVYRIILFYCLSLFLVGLIVPYNNPHLAGAKNASSSPFVIAMDLGGVKVMPHIFNAVILVSVLSVGNSASYGASRTIAGMALAGQAPKIFGYIDNRGRPVVALGLSLVIGCLAYLQYASGQDVIFSWLLALSGLSSIITWGSVCAAHIRFRLAFERQGHSLDELPWKSPLGIWGSVFGLVFNVVVLLLNFYISVAPIHPAADANGRAYDFFQSYLTVPVVIAFFVFAKLKWRVTMPALEDIDLDTGREIVPLDILRAEREESNQLPTINKLWNLLC